MDEDGTEACFDDPWWDELAIDHETESQLQVIEQTGQPSPTATPDSLSCPTLQAQIQEVHTATLIAAPGT